MTIRWTRSSRCSDGSCVSAAHVDGAVRVADEHGGVIVVSHEVWATVVDGICDGHTNPLPSSIHVTTAGVMWEGVSADGGTDLVVLRYTPDEWAQFVEGAKRGDFDNLPEQINA